jgi:hypothetical protein
MSYDIMLWDTERAEIVRVARHEEGGTYVQGGTTEASLNVTYNYSRYYYKHLDAERGIRWLYDETGAACIDRLERAIAAIEADEETEREERERIAENRRRARAEPPPAPPSPGDSPMVKLAHTLWQSSVDGPTGYWFPSRENAARPLRTLLAWARQHPTAVFDGD